jgi:hypothetical protein
VVADLMKKISVVRVKAIKDAFKHLRATLPHLDWGLSDMAIGTVLFKTSNEKGTFGFMIDEAIGYDDRETNVYFDTRSLADRSIEVASGQRYRFEYDDKGDKPRTKFKSMEKIQWVISKFHHDKIGATSAARLSEIMPVAIV